MLELLKSGHGIVGLAAILADIQNRSLRTLILSELWDAANEMQLSDEERRELASLTQVTKAPDFLH